MSIIEDQSGKRHNDRNACELKAECLKLTGRSEVFRARSINYSKDGLCFRSGYNIRPRAHIFLTIEDSDRVHDSKEFAADRIAKVIWCRKILSSPTRSAFNIENGSIMKRARKSHSQQTEPLPLGNQSIRVIIQRYWHSFSTDDNAIPLGR